MARLTSLEICSGAGGQALGLERAGFDPVMLIDNDPDACETIRRNRPHWDVRCLDLLDFVGSDHERVLDVDLLAGGTPRLAYSVAGKRRKPEHERRDELRAAVWLATEVRPRAIMLENVPALVKEARFAETRGFVEQELENSGYELAWRILDAQDFGVPQRREHGVIVAMRPEDMIRFEWPEATGTAATVGEVLWESMASRGWRGAKDWRDMANEVAPTIVGGSKKRGGADLGPSRTKSIWARLGVNGGSLSNEVPGPDFVLDPGDIKEGLPRLTVEQVAVLQAFPHDWYFAGGKTSRYRQVGQAMPPPLAAALGRQIVRAMTH
ncbi:cytosine-specific methyltransferase [Actinomadura sp. NBRC 104412]|uniref:DNA cytosine methyltransferase n=1 Tax=Actinomadura sp. NBRC 104412 TaxID=3032203 RepID=UPI0024A2B48F|nr:DNA cytosine methyltransferase [Actinomadura sp. NBRC 104412]GLZ08906.1 cytosine-specific methyltransferase [Actinomadura sp. NBRC 104412]